MHNWDWNDMRLILAVAEYKSFSNAVRSLNVNHSTVLRRVNTFEHEHGHKIFHRLSAGYTLTEAGEEFLRTAEIKREAVSELALELEGRDLQLNGVLRIITCDTLIGSTLPKIFSKFSQLRPKITVVFSTGSFVNDLA